MGFFNKIKNVALSFINDDFLNAITSACALVSYADGDASSEEKQKMLKYMKLNDDLKHFKLSQIEEKYEKFTESLAFDLEIGKIECFKAIEVIKDNRENAEKLVALCFAIAKSDGVIDSQELVVLEQIIARLGLRVQNYNLSRLQK